MSITNPIIIFGTGRSGTTVFHQMLSEHPNLAWLSPLINKYPDKFILNKIIMRLFENPSLANVLRKRIKPVEGYAFWEYYSKGFSAPCRDLLSDDVSVKMKKNILDVMALVTTKNRNRLLLKITGWPRIGFLSEIFEDAKFIHVVRDGRAVANSLINVGFWRGWGGPEKWRWGPLSQSYQNEWENHNQSFIALAALQWKILMDATENAKRFIKASHILEIRYEDICVDPLAILKKTAEFCEIEWNEYFEARLKTYSLRNTNTKYNQELSIQQQEVLNSVLCDYLEKYGYR